MTRSKILQAESDKAPNRLDLLMAMGNTAVRAGKYDFAIQTYNKVLGADGKGRQSQGDIYLRIGETYRRKGDAGGAVQALQKARETLPRQHHRAQHAGAGAGWRAAASPRPNRSTRPPSSCDPNNAVVLNNLAFLLAETGGDLDDALTKAQRAKQMLPSLSEISDTLGWIYLKKNLADNAIDIFKDLVTKQPSHSTYHYHLGMAYSQKGDKTTRHRAVEGSAQVQPGRRKKRRRSRN